MKILLALILSLAPLALPAARALQPQAMGAALVDRDDDGRAALRVSPTANFFANMPGGSSGSTSGVSITAITGSAATSYFDKLTSTATSIFASITTLAATLTSSLTSQQGAAGSLTVLAASYNYPTSKYAYAGAGAPVSVTVRTISTAVTQISVTSVAGANLPTNVYLMGTPTAGTVLYCFTPTGVTPPADSYYAPYVLGTTPITPQPIIGTVVLWLKTVTGTYDMGIWLWQ